MCDKSNQKLSKFVCFFEMELSRDVFLTFSYPSQLKHLVLRAFLAGNLPKKLSKLGVLDERGMNKSKNTLHRSVSRVTFAVKAQ